MRRWLGYFPSWLIHCLLFRSRNVCVILWNSCISSTLGVRIPLCDKALLTISLPFASFSGHLLPLNDILSQYSGDLSSLGNLLLCSRVIGRQELMGFELRFDFDPGGGEDAWVSYSILVRTSPLTSASKHGSEYLEKLYVLSAESGGKLPRPMPLMGD